MPRTVSFEEENGVRPIAMLDLKAEYPAVEARIRSAIDEVLNSQQFIGGPQVIELEKRIAALVHAEQGVAVGTGTDAILVALMALGVGPGDEVITAPFTFFATAGCIHRLGAKPVFVDIEADTFNIDPEQIEARITDRTRAIIAVHLFGQCADVDTIAGMAKAGGIPVLEDAAQAIGAMYKDRPAGSLGRMGCFSFYPTKNLGGFGEGGMITTSDASLAERCRQLRNHGETSRYHHRLVGGNFRLDTMKAAILLAKLEMLESFNARRAANAALYDALLADVPDVQTPVIRAFNRSCYHQYSILCRRRDELKERLAADGIGTGVYYPVPLHLQECFADLGYERGDCPISEETAGRVLSLPVHPALSEEDVVRVADAVRRFYGHEAAQVAVGRTTETL